MTTEKVQTILESTNGELRYLEQYYQIGIEVLGFNQEELDFIRKAYTKRNLADLKRVKELVSSHLSDSSLETYVMHILPIHLPYLNWKLVRDIQEKNKKMMIANILETSSGELTYYFQAFMLLNEVIGIRDFHVSTIIEHYAKGVDIETEFQYMSKHLPEHPQIVNIVHNLLMEKSATLLSNVPMGEVHSSNWNEEELLQQIDNYFDNTTKEQFQKDLEETGCLPYVEEA